MMKSLKKIFELAEKFEKRAQSFDQADIGTGESKAVMAVASNQVQAILAANGLTNKAEYIQFNVSVMAPNFSPKAVNLTSVEVYAGFDEPEATKAKEAGAQIMGMKTLIEGSLSKFYKTSEGNGVLKNSGSPPNFVIVFKWKLR